MTAATEERLHRRPRRGRGRARSALGFVGLLFGLSATVAPRGHASPGDLRRELQRFASTVDGKALRAGVYFAPLQPRGTAAGPGSDSPEVRWNEDVPLVPASVVKIATSAAVLDRFGPRHEYRTVLSASSPPVEGVLRGDLYVRGGGDPFLVTERLWLLVHLLRQSGLREVQGRLVIDEGAFAPESEDPSRLARESSERPYAARLTPLALNFNTVALRVQPGPAVGDPAHVALDPLPIRYLRIESRVRTAAAGARSDWTLGLSPAPEESESDGIIEVASLTGSIAAGEEPAVEYRSVRRPRTFSADLLRAFLEDGAIRIAGPDAFEATPPDARILLEFPSLPLDELISGMNRHSNNFMADLLCMSLCDSAATLEQGADRLASWIEETTGTPGSAVLHDGSGLDPRDRLTAEALGRVLTRAGRDLRTGPALLRALPAPGEDGTLRRRLHGEELSTRIRAKTGTLGDARACSLAGYLETSEGLVAFVLLMNGEHGSSWTVPRLQDLQDAWLRLYLR